jgi:hypothetical protein
MPARNAPPTQTRHQTGAIAALLLTLVGMPLLLLFMHRDRDAYPSEPAKERALEMCSQTDPNFVRFRSADRTACYERISRASQDRDLASPSRVPGRAPADLPGDRTTKPRWIGRAGD